jgi:hypothetical protein
MYERANRSFLNRPILGVWEGDVAAAFGWGKAVAARSAAEKGNACATMMPAKEVRQNYPPPFFALYTLDLFHIFVLWLCGKQPLYLQFTKYCRHFAYDLKLYSVFAYWLIS